MARYTVQRAIEGQFGIVQILVGVCGFFGLFYLATTPFLALLLSQSNEQSYTAVFRQYPLWKESLISLPSRQLQMRC